MSLNKGSFWCDVLFLETWRDFQESTDLENKTSFTCSGDMDARWLTAAQESIFGVKWLIIALEKEGEKRRLVLFRKRQVVIRLFPISRRQFRYPTGVSLQCETRGHGKERFKLAYETVPAPVDLWNSIHPGIFHGFLRYIWNLARLLAKVLSLGLLYAN